jgi:D-methionine transport system permease protein
MLPNLFNEIASATGETLYMVFLSTLIATLLGLPLGTWVFITKRIQPHRPLNLFLNSLINITRSVPFIIFLVALIPLTRLILGTSIGVNAAIIPLSFGAIPFFARLTDNAYQRLPSGLLDTGFSMGATTFQMIRNIFLPEAKPALIQGVTLTAVTLVNYSAMAGTVGGGGLGDLAIRYGYQRFDSTVMIITVILLVLLVQGIQWIGDTWASSLEKGKKICA